MSLVVVVFIGLCLYAMIRVLNLASPSLPPSIYSKTRNSEFIQAILSSCPILREPYVPPLLWGKSGHIQTVVYAKLGRVRDPIPSGTRYTKTLQDGSTLTFDIYQPDTSHPTNEDFCMLVCPGFGSSSESSYIRALVTHAQSCGYRVAVLNHLGCVFSLRLTAPRIFSYGGWEEFHIMREEVEHLYPQCKLILVGLSMGANIVIKYLGEQLEHQRGIWCAISICQGYNINHAKHLLKKWQSLRRAYLYTMTANQRRLIKHHSDILFSEEARRRFGFDLKKIFSATTLEDLDLHFTCKLQGVQNVVDYYETASCSNYISNINIPLVLLNSEDDPIVPLPLLKYARDYTESHDQAALVTTKHGGHLGFFESGFFKPQITSWIDRFVCQISDSVIAFTLRKQLITAGPSSHIIPLQVRTPSFGQQLETTLDAPEPEDNNLDLAIGEGSPRKVKSSSSDLLGLGKRTSLDTVSEESGESLESLCCLITDSCEVKDSSSESNVEDAKTTFSQQGLSVSLPEIIMEGDADESTIARDDVDVSSIRTENAKHSFSQQGLSVSLPEIIMEGDADESTIAREDVDESSIRTENAKHSFSQQGLRVSLPEIIMEGDANELTIAREDVDESSIRTENAKHSFSQQGLSVSLPEIIMEGDADESTIAREDVDESSIRTENAKHSFSQQGLSVSLPEIIMEGDADESTIAREDVDESSIRVEKERSEVENGRREFVENEASVRDHCPRQPELASSMNEEDAAESTIAREDVDESSVKMEEERSEVADGRRSKECDSENEASVLDHCPRQPELASAMNEEDAAESTTVQEDVDESSVRTEKERSEVENGRREFDENEASVLDHCPRQPELASAMNEEDAAESTTVQEDVDESSVRTEKERSEVENGRREFDENEASVLDYCPRQQEASAMNEEDAAESTIARGDVDESSVRTEKERSEVEDSRRSKDFDENEASMLDYCPRQQELPSSMNGEDTAENVQLVYSRNKSPTERDLGKKYIASDSYAEIIAEASSAMNDNTAEKLASFQNMSLKETGSAKEHSTASKTNEEMSARNTASAKANSEAVGSKVPFPGSAEEQQPISLREEEQRGAREQRSCEAFRNCVRWDQEGQHLEETAKNPAVQSVHRSPNHVSQVFSATANFDQEAQPLEETAKNQPLHYVSQVLSTSTANFEEKINQLEAATSTVSAGRNQTDTAAVKSGSSLCERAEEEFSECASSVNGNTLDSHTS
ncbi:uro-adherence factor A-like isoform X2 [Littorina saxatilis]|uniref:AB hydrolase-1 domain-containing protein n=1 Tax=Littorina saxatilis TaxID=31220 RepID=A0AAN9G5K7_9CAEN